MAGWQLLHVEASPPFVLNKSINHSKQTEMEKTAKFVLEYEVKIDQKDKNNLNGLVSAIQEVLEVGQIIMLPLRKTQKTIILDGRKISVLESEVDTRKAVRVLRMI